MVLGCPGQNVAVLNMYDNVVVYMSASAINKMFLSKKMRKVIVIDVTNMSL